ncbi:MAG: aminoglycoside 6-adenylyltransferase [Chloroflexota bacterium]
MQNDARQESVIRQFAAWGAARDAVRAMLLTSSRAVPNAPLDAFSDYDVILILRDIHPFHEDRTWLGDFGPVLVMYRDPIMIQDGWEKSGLVVQYENGFKIDFTLWPVQLLQKIAADPQLPDEFDAGYQIILDKDQLTNKLQAPTYAAYIPHPPSQTAYQTMIEELFLDATYVAKLLWRDDIMAAKHILDDLMKLEYLLPMLEWHAEIAHNWSVKPGPYGRRLKGWLRPDLWAELESTYTGADIAANWDALYKTIALMRHAALEVGQNLGYTYPQDLETRVMTYLQTVQHLPPNAALF